MTPELDIVIPVYNEGHNIVAVLAALKHALATPARVLICYDHEDDDTLPALRANAQTYACLPVELVRNAGRGPHGAVMTSHARSHGRTGARRLRHGRGRRDGRCPWLKAALVRSANFTLRHLARLPTTDFRSPAAVPF